MPLLDTKKFDFIGKFFHFSVNETLEFYKSLQWADPHREWTDREWLLAQAFRKESVSLQKIAKILNRDVYQVIKKFEIITVEQAKEQFAHKQSAGATKLEQLITESFGRYKLVKEFKLKDVQGHRQLYLDFYLPQLKIGFEYNGEQHDHFVEAWHQTAKGFADSQKRDLRKDALCQRYGIKLIRFSWKDRPTQERFVQKLNEINWGLNGTRS